MSDTPEIGLPSDSSIVLDIPRPIPEKPDFYITRWAESDRNLSLQSKKIMEQKGWSRNVDGLLNSVVRDSEHLLKPHGYHREGDQWVSGNPPLPVELTSSEVDFLQRRMPNAPEGARDCVVARYLGIRHALNMSGEWENATKRDDEMMSEKPELIPLLIEAAFQRELVGEGASFHNRSPNDVWLNNQNRLGTISHGHRVMRELAEKMPNIGSLS